MTDDLACKYEHCDGTFHKVPGREGRLSSCPISFARSRIKALVMEGISFDNFDLAYNDDKKIKDKVIAFLTDDNLHLILRGMNGRGKSHLARATLREYLKGMIDGAIVSDAEFTRTASDIYSEGDDRDIARDNIYNWKKVPVLIYDDFNTKPYTIHALTMMQEMLDARDYMGHTTIFTTNKKKEDKVGVANSGSPQITKEWQQRLGDRVTYRALDIEVKGKNYRKEGR